MYYAYRTMWKKFHECKIISCLAQKKLGRRTDLQLISSSSFLLFWRCKNPKMLLVLDYIDVVDHIEEKKESNRTKQKSVTWRADIKKGDICRREDSRTTHRVELIQKKNHLKYLSVNRYWNKCFVLFFFFLYSYKFSFVWSILESPWPSHNIP